MSSDNVIRTSNSNIAKKMYIFSFITASPLLVFLAIYLHNPQSFMLNDISTIINNVPTLHSVNNFLLRSVMSAYCKTAPVWALILVLFSYKELHLKTDKSISLLTRTLVLFTVLYLGIITLLLFHNADLTESGRLLRMMSANDYFLILLFLSIFLVGFILTTYYAFFIYAFCKTVNSTKKAH